MHKELIVRDVTVTGKYIAPPGAYCIGVANIGLLPGKVNDNSLSPGETVNYQAPECIDNGQLYVLPRIAIDGTGTTLKVTAIYYT